MTVSGPRFTLRRLSSSPNGTFGQLLDADERLVCLTLERPYVDANHDGLTDPNVSCIPAGTFAAHRRLGSTSKRGYDVFELEGVPGRSVIQIHIGNHVDQSEGCILLGSNFGPFAGKPGLLGSAAAFRSFMHRLVGVDRITLTVVDPPTENPHE